MYKHTLVFKIFLLLMVLPTFTVIANAAKWSLDLYRAPENGFYTTIDIATDKYRRFDKNTFPYNLNMGIALYTKSCILFGNPNIFSSKTFQCLGSDSGCSDLGKKGDYIFHSYNVSGSVLNLNNIAFEKWGASGEAVLVEQISTLNPKTRYEALYGIFGMGASRFETNPLEDTDVFSIYLDHSDRGKIYFYEEQGHALEIHPLAQLQTRGDWMLDFTTFSLNEFNWKIQEEPIPIIFDFNKDTISLPIVLYKAVVQNFLSRFGVICPSAMLEKPFCQYSGDIKLLPNLTFHIRDQNLTLPPQVYVYNAENIESQSYITLLLSSNSIGRNMGTNTPPLFSGVFLGEPFFNHYFTVFNTKDRTLSLFTAKARTLVDEIDFSHFRYIVVFLIVFLIAYCCIIRRKGAKKAEEKVLTQEVPTDEVYIPDHSVPDLPRRATNQIFKKSD